MIKVTPTSRAVPVAAARPGWRTALSTASRPGTPTRAGSAPRTRTDAGMRTTVAIMTPTKEINPPRIPALGSGKTAPTTISATPRTKTAPPAKRRRNRGRV
ncbi:hypothetical protein [Ornithinimicrobium kibberense]|uniref:hypothetical protein n=1 Tax=Ornithinimicrobium kibberense TaxID=282060 RepID=UPI0036105216